jgi:hypothetical protein
MANEIMISAGFQASKSGATISASESGSFDMTGDDMVQGTQLIGTAAEVLNLGEVSGDVALLFAKNLDATNFVEIALDSGMTQKFIKLRPGRFALLPPATATLYAKADTASCRLQIAAVEV